MEMDKERFRLKSGRERPPFQAKNIRCSGCGAGLTVKNEHTEMVVCDYCGSRLDLTAEELTVLGKVEGNTPPFPIALGDSYRYRAARFEVIARLAQTEDNDPSETTREYLLYHPRRGTMWLAEYHGQYSMTEPSHVMPQTDAFRARRGDVLATHDGKTWICEGTGTYTLGYVDGALPWIAAVGDTVQYAEFSRKDGHGEQYEVQRIQDEIEFGMGRRLELESVRHAMKKPDLGTDAAARPDEDPAVRRNYYVQMIAILFIAALINGLGTAYCYFAGREVFRQNFSPAALTEGVLSEPFHVNGGGELTKIIAESPLNNAWMSIDAAIVRDSDQLAVHTYETEMEYYHGYDGGESWTEGSRTNAYLIRIPEAGDYRLYIAAVSANGNASTSQRDLHPLTIRIKEGALQWWKFATAGILSLGLLILMVSRYVQWKQEDDDDD